MPVPTILLRLPLLALALFAFLAGVWGGLIRLGWEWHPGINDLIVAHGPLMIGGFLGTLISLERAAALGHPAWYAMPLAAGAGAAFVIYDFNHAAGPLLITLSSLGLAAAGLLLLKRQPALFTGVMGAGALAWLGGNILWLQNRPVSDLVLVWAGFPILTICGERLELSRVLAPSRRRRQAFLAAVLLFGIGLVASVPWRNVGYRLAGLGMIALALWLATNDVARRTVRQPGITRFAALSLLAGYAWLGVGGAWIAVGGFPPPGPRYDAFLHSVFLGFVFSMIFGHAPIIVPALLGRPFRHLGSLYVPLALLHASVLIRVGGNGLGAPGAVQTGGLLNAAAILLFFLLFGASVAAQARRERSRSGRPS